jgi:hypothetical protein
MQELIIAAWMSQAIAAAADLGIADALAKEPLGLHELADRVGADPDALKRLLRALIGQNILRQGSAHRWAACAHLSRRARQRLRPSARGTAVPVDSGLIARHARNRVLVNYRIRSLTTVFDVGGLGVEVASCAASSWCSYAKSSALLGISD